MFVNHSPTFLVSEIHTVTMYVLISIELMYMYTIKSQVCVAAADEVKCHPINTWRDEDQELTKVHFTFHQSYVYCLYV